MSRWRGAGARSLTVLITASFVAALLATGTAFVAPTAAAASPGGCDSKQNIAFIAFPTINGLEDMQQPLRKLTRLWPVKSLKFRYMTAPFDTSPSGIDTMVNELESRVSHLESLGYNRIGLPSISALLDPFIHGTAGSLGGVPLQTRHPNTVFVTINNGTSATEDLTAAGNVFRFLDVPSLADGVKIGVQAATAPGAEMLIIHQNGDVVSDGTMNEFLGIASDLGFTPTAYGISWNGSNFSASDLAGAKTVLDNLPAGSLVVHAVNGGLSNQYATDAGSAGIFTDHSSNGPIRHFGGNFFPSTAIPVDLELGYSPVEGPSWQSTRAGFSTTYKDFANDPRQREYMEALGFLARCGRFHGILDSFMRFDAGGTRIAKQLERDYLPANTTTIATGERIDNPRWDNEQVTWNWKVVFNQ
jgi:hypothetical protein